MSDPEDIIIAMYADYRLWCRERGIPPETWEIYHNIVTEHYEVEPILPFLDRLNMEKGTRGYWGINGPTHYTTPIQPNDEDRAVAEVLRMLGGK